MNKATFKILIFFIYMVFVTVLSLMPGSGESHLFPGADKIVHFLLYSGFGFVSISAFAEINDGSINFYHFVKIIAFCSIYGLFMELCQAFVPLRSAEFLDGVANFLGSFAGVAFFYMGVRRKKIVENRIF